MAKKQTEVVKAKSNLPVESDLLEDMASHSGGGMEGADKDSFAIPFLSLLQKGSPQVDADSPSRLKGAESGMFFNSVTQELLDGRKGFEAIACAYQRKWIRWESRKNGGGYKGEFDEKQIASMVSSGAIVQHENRLYIPESGGKITFDKDGKVNEDLVSDTRNHFILITQGGEFRRVVLSLSSTQIKKSRHLLTALSTISWELPNGRKFNPPTFAVRIILKSVPESNAKGNWSGVGFEISGRANAEEYSEAKKFHDQVIGGEVSTVTPRDVSEVDAEEKKGF